MPLARKGLTLGWAEAFRTWFDGPNRRSVPSMITATLSAWLSSAVRWLTTMIVLPMLLPKLQITENTSLIRKMLLWKACRPDKAIKLEVG